jgi:putative oxidoreductase
MVVAIVAVHLPNGFFAQANGYELPLVYAVSGVVLAILGPGMFSLDALLGLSGVWNASVAWFTAGGAVVVGLVNVALRRPVTRPVATAQR